MYLIYGSCQIKRVERIDKNTAISFFYNAPPQWKVRGNNRHAPAHIFKHLYRQGIDIVRVWPENHNANQAAFKGGNNFVPTNPTVIGHILPPRHGAGARLGGGVVETANQFKTDRVLDIFHRLQKFEDSPGFTDISDIGHAQPFSHIIDGFGHLVIDRVIADVDGVWICFLKLVTDEGRGSNDTVKPGTQHMHQDLQHRRANTAKHWVQIRFCKELDWHIFVRIEYEFSTAEQLDERHQQQQLRVVELVDASIQSKSGPVYRNRSKQHTKQPSPVTLHSNNPHAVSRFVWAIIGYHEGD